MSWCVRSPLFPLHCNVRAVVYMSRASGYDARMYEPQSDIRTNNLIIPVGAPPTESSRKVRARGTTPPPKDVNRPAADGEIVTCKKCNAHVAFATAYLTPTHCLCTACALDGAREAALVSLPKNADTIKLERRMGMPLVALICMFVFTAALVAVYNY